MKIAVFFPLVLCLVQADSSDKQDVKLKATHSTMNNISPTQKPEIYYQMKLPQQLQPSQQLQQYKQQYVPVQIIQKPYYVAQPQPQAMIIIAHPALVPSSLLYGNPTQQLLNYFHNNPQAKYHLLHGNYQQQIPQQQQFSNPQQSYMHISSSPSIGNYILTSPPQYQQQQHFAPLQQYSAPQQYTSPQLTQMNNLNVPQARQIGGISHLAQLAAQEFAASTMRNAPAIVTGFENFSPEQQAEIKAQLSSHLGTGFHAVSANNNNQYSSKYIADQSEFMPSQPVKNDVSSMASSGSADIISKKFNNKE